MSLSHLELLKDITLGIATTSDHDGALRVSLEVLCAHFGIPAGVLWTVDADGRVLPRHVHADDDPDLLLAQLAGLSEDPPGGAVLGALLSGYTTSATWSLAGQLRDQVSEVLAARGHGATTAHAVVAGDRCVAILQMAFPDPTRPDHEVLAVIETVAAQLGTLIVREQARDEARERAARTKSILDGSADAFLSIGPDGLIQSWNRAAAELFGWTAEEVLGRALTDTIATAAAIERYRGDVVGMLTTGQSGLQRRPFEATLRRRDGSTFTAEIVVWRTDLAAGDWILSGFVRDVSDDRARQRELASSREQLEQAQQVAQMGSWDYDATTGVLSWSDQYKANLGLPLDAEPSAQLLLSVTHPDDRDRLRSTLRRVDRVPGPFTHEHRVVHPDGEVRRMRATGMTVHDADGRLLRSWGAVRDVTEEHRLREAIAHRNRHDALTDLVNRSAFQEAIEAALGTVGSAGTVTVALIDIDGFSQINERIGSSNADHVLVEVANRLRAACARPGTLAARIGGDEFAVLVTSAEGVETSPTSIAMEARELLAAPIQVGDAEVVVQASIGIAVHDARHGRPGEDGDALLRSAALALETAEARGGDVWQLYEPEMHAEALARLALRSDLEHAVRTDQIQTYYQPVVAVESGTTVGFEALARWERHGHGFVPPDVFIPLVEQDGLIIELGRRVLWRACRDLARFRAVNDDAADLTVAVNVSPFQLADPGLVGDVQEALAGADLPASALVLELTESVLADDAVDAVGRLRELEAIGVQLAIDDFGTGYSSLARLRDFPAHLLKIDRSFLRDVHGPSDEPAILGALFSLAATLGMRVVTEGVETPEHLAVVLGHAGQEVQGYLFGRPLPAEDVIHLLEDPSWDLETLDTTAGDDLAVPDLDDHRLATALRGLVQEPTPARFAEVLHTLAAVAGLAGAYLVRGVPPDELTIAFQSGGGTLAPVDVPRHADLAVPVYRPDGEVFGRLAAVYADGSDREAGAEALLELVGRAVTPLLDEIA